MEKKSEKNKKTHFFILYGVAILALIISIISLLGNISPSKTDYDWRCSYADCEEYLDVDGEEWARENCRITAEGTICLATFDDGRQFEIPLEEINLSAITATKCTQFICTEEMPYRITNYPIDIEDFQR